MALHMPNPEELIDFVPPADASMAFENVAFSGLSWKAFLVTTSVERDCLYQTLNVHDIDQQVLEDALRHDRRKICVRRCIWDAQIRSLLDSKTTNADTSPPPKQQQARHRDPAAMDEIGPAKDTSLLADVNQEESIDEIPYNLLGSSTRTTPVADGTSSADDEGDDDLTRLRLGQLNQVADVFRQKPSPVSSNRVSPITTSTTSRINEHVAPPPHHRSSSFPFVYPGDARQLVGIENQANTCYLNAALQTLFHIPYFRRCIYDVHVESLKRKDVTKSLQSLFAALQLRYPAVSTVPLTDAFGWSQEELRHQHDAHEMILILFDCLEKQLGFLIGGDRSTSAEAARSASAPEVDSGLPTSATTAPPSPEKAPMVNFIQKLFRGEQSYVTRAVDCDYVSYQSEPLLVVEVAVQNLVNLDESLKELTRPATIDGFIIENEATKTKSTHTVERALQFTKLPPVLLIHPNRVVFDMEKLAQVTVNSKWTFPVHLDLSEFTSKTTAADAADDVDSDGEALVDSPLTVPTRPTPPQPHETFANAAEEAMQRDNSLCHTSSEEYGPADYELRMVVLHCGTAANGHYISCVRLGEELWMCLNDNHVSCITEAEVLRRAYGGQRLESIINRDERAKLLVYVRKSAAAKLLSEVPIPNGVRDLAAEHERRIEMEYHIMNEIFASALGSRKIDTLNGALQRLTIRASSTFADVIAQLAAKHRVPPSHVLVWKYGYRYVEHSSDRACRVLSVDVLGGANLVVELLSEPAENSALITSCYPTRVFLGHKFYYAGIARSVDGAIDVGLEVLSAHDEAEDRDASPQRPKIEEEEKEGDPDEAGHTEPVKSSQTEERTATSAKKVREASSLCVFAYYGSASLLRLVDTYVGAIPPINGVNLIVAPRDAAVADIRALLEALPMDVTIFAICPTFIDDAIELWTQTIDENTDYENLQDIICDRLHQAAAASAVDLSSDSVTSNGSSGMLPEFLFVQLPVPPHRIGLHSHHIDTCGPSRTLSEPMKKYSGSFHMRTKLRDLVRNNNSTAVVRRVYFEILPAGMNEIAAHMLQFVVCTGFSRRAFAYINRNSHDTVGSIRRAIHDQLIHTLTELRHVPHEHLRILGLDWYGKIIRVYSVESQLLTGIMDVYTFVVDVMDIAPQPLRPQSDVAATCIEDDDDDDDERVHTAAASPAAADAVLSLDLPEGWGRFDVYHVTRYGAEVDYIAPPTNVVLRIDDWNQLTGEYILESIIAKLYLDEEDPVLLSIRKHAKVVLRGRFALDVVTLQRDECVTNEMLDRICSVQSILLDHTECMFASKTPSPGRSPAKPGGGQRIPEAAIRICYDD